MRISWRVGAAGVLVACLAVGGCGSSEGSGDGSGGTFTVAVIGSYTGPLAAVSTPSGTAGLTAAISTVNDAGGAGGRKIEIKRFDARSTAEGAQEAGRAAIAARPDVIFMPDSSLTQDAVVPLLRQVSIPTFVASPNKDLLSPEPTRWYFSLAATSAEIGQYLVDFAARRLGGSIEGRKVAYFGIDAPTCMDIVAAMEKNVEVGGGKMVDVQKHSFSATNVTTQAQKIVNSGAEVVLSCDAGNGAVLDVQGLQAAGFDGPVIFGEGAASKTLFSTVGAPNVFAAVQYRPVEDSSVAMDAMKKYKQATDGGWVTMGWTLGTYLGKVLADCGSCDSSALIKTIETAKPFMPPGDIVFGPLQFSSDRHTWLSKTGFYSTSSKSAPATQRGGLVTIDR